jgi:hypothetical protein
VDLVWCRRYSACLCGEVNVLVQCESVGDIGGVVEMYMEASSRDASVMVRACSGSSVKCVVCACNALCCV